jgi:Mrp family chromosome partitioning ATPase
VCHDHFNTFFDQFYRTAVVDPRLNNDVTKPRIQNSRTFSTTITTTTIFGASPRQMAVLEEQVWSAVTAHVTDPETEQTLAKLGWVNRRLAVSENNTIQILLQLPSLLYPSLNELQSMIKHEAKQATERWIEETGLKQNYEGGNNLHVNVNVEVLPQKPVPWLVQAKQQDQEDVNSRLGPGLANVSHFLAVYSCKGGVGKSTVAINLAYELARLGGRVGILDVDIYGPSLPVLIQPDDPAVRRSPLGSNMVYPIAHKGVKMLSLGFVSSYSGVPGSGKDGGAATLRGPMAGRVTTQLLKGTDWGDLDVLILDLPPGTGDVQLTVCQEIDLSFAVGVTTPSKLAIADAKKGISMFASMGIDTIAIVENMSYFECDAGVRHYPFGRGFTGNLTSVTADELSRGNTPVNPDNVCQLPVSEIANEANENGIPICISRPEKAKNELEAFEKLAKIVSRELFRLPFRVPRGEGSVVVEDETFDLSSIQLSADKDALIVRFFSEAGALQKRIPAQALRSRDPKTGAVINDSGDLQNEHNVAGSLGGDGMVTKHKVSSNGAKASSVVPEKVEKKARVGFEVTWSDGARYIYSRQAIAIAAGGKILN